MIISIPFSKLLKTEFTDRVSTPVGVFLIKATESGVRSISLFRDITSEIKPNPITEAVKSQVSEYFAKLRRQFELPIDYEGLSPFQIKVMYLLNEIPYGTVISYTELAIQNGDLKSIRAVANANARNPLPIIVPCHRVIGKSGHLTGYALGIEVKKALLIHENPQGFSIQQRLEL